MKEDDTKPVIRNYKDTVFRMLFSDKKNLLSLYNLMSSKQYTDPDLLEIVTLDNAIYMNMKNDLAFLVDSTLCMYEHQSTFSPNLPLRNLFYVAREYEKLVNTVTLYSSKLVTLPAPSFVVFYNGRENGWSRRELKLSKAFQPIQGSPKLELVVDEININLGMNDEVLSQCKPLQEYMQYIDKVRTYADIMPTNEAVEKAVTECIKEGILEEFLLKNRSEAIHMSIFEYDEEREMKLIRADERELGREEGKEIGKEIGKAIGLEEGERIGSERSIIQFIQYDLSHNITEEQIIQKLIAIFSLKYEEIDQIMQQAKMGLN